jgi:hypothetical protein
MYHQTYSILSLSIICYFIKVKKPLYNIWSALWVSFHEAGINIEFIRPSPDPSVTAVYASFMLYRRCVAVINANKNDWLSFIMSFKSVMYCWQKWQNQHFRILSSVEICLIISTLRWGDTSTNTRQYSNLCSTQCL